MTKYIIATVIILFIISCKGKNKSLKTENQNLEDLIPGPIAHESLSEEQLNKINFIHKTFIEVYPISIEESITNFKRDQNPDNEINIWLNMIKAYEPFASKNLGEEKIDLRKEGFKLILMRSMMSEKEAIKSSELKLLSETQVQEILINYTLKGKPIKTEKK